MLMLKRSAPINYDVLCKQTVTVYHKEGEEYIRKVYSKAFLDYKKTQSVDKTGSKEAISFLLVIPGDTQTVFCGDKVLVGVGEEILTREQWAALVPAKKPGLVVVSYVDCKYWNGKMIHTEAGG